MSDFKAGKRKKIGVWVIIYTNQEELLVAETEIM